MYIHLVSNDDELKKENVWNLTHFVKNKYLHVITIDYMTIEIIQNIFPKLTTWLV